MTASWFASLGRKLVASYVAALVLALAAFGAGAVLVINRDLHASLDVRLATVANAALNFVDLKQGVVQIDEHDRAEIFALLGSQMNVVVMSDASGIVLSTTARPPSELLQQSRAAHGPLTLKYADDTLRALVLPIVNGKAKVGEVIAWASTTWIAVTDRQVAIAFAIAALLLAAVALLAGSALSRRALDDTFERQRRFTTDAAHELRAPLSIIRAEADLALRRDRDASAYQSALGTIANEAAHMEQLVSALLVAARAEAHQHTEVPVDMLAVARNVCERLRSTADVKHIRLDVTPGEARALGDLEALQRAMTAIVHNAVKHTTAGSTIYIWCEQRGGRLETYVRDGGPGFSQEALQHGLEWFWREDTGRSGDQATGLGLAIARSVTNASGGSVALANAPQGGGLVTISLRATSP